jgi:hypothetical protein
MSEHQDKSIAEHSIEMEKTEDSMCRRQIEHALTCQISEEELRLVAVFEAEEKNPSRFLGDSPSLLTQDIISKEIEKWSELQVPLKKE